MILSEHKWLKIIIKDKHPRVNANASYNHLTKKITLYDNFFKHSKKKQDGILEHEYAHHIYYKMPLIYRKIWGLISNGKLIKLLNIMWITPHNKNAHVNDYAKTSAREDWAECIEADFLWEKYIQYTWFKIRVAVSMFEYFDKK
jgi:hypothetical protein